MAFLACTHGILQATPTRAGLNPKRALTRSSIQFQTIPTPQASFSDQFVLQLAESLEDSLPLLPPPPIQKLRDSSSERLLSTPWPSRKDEAFRFTDTSFLKSSQIVPVSHPPESLPYPETPKKDETVATLVIGDGFVLDSFCDYSGLPDGVYVGRLSELSSDVILKRVSEFLGAFEHGDLFWSINGIGAPDLLVLYVPEGCRVEKSVYLKYFSVEAGDEGTQMMSISNPRVLVLVEKDAEIQIIEEFAGERGKIYWANPVLEVVIGEGGKLIHSYLQTQSFAAAHIKCTSVLQERASTYELVEVSTGGRLSRHNVHVQQLGPDTVTKLTTVHLSVGDQTQDLHSKIVLDHPNGYSRQLHKCVVAHPSGQSVFDGNIKVNRFAHKTDAGQLTRTLLLEPRATVNVKPNLQIVASDVKCSHGAAVSDLEESQLFYFRARGIDVETARKALVVSFGWEVIERLPSPLVRRQVERRVKDLLENAGKG